jgi:hypothetical protein
MQRSTGLTHSFFKGLNDQKEHRQQMSTRAEYMMFPNDFGITFSQYLKARDEILRHKSLESEKAGSDIGFEAALSGWISQHRDAWLKAQVATGLTGVSLQRKRKRN